MIVRSFQLADYSCMNEVLEEVLSEECYEDTMEALARQLSWDSELVLVAEMDGRIVGVIIGTIDNNKGYYYRLAVRNDFQRKGIGTSLIHALKQRFHQRKVSKILINVDSHNEPVVSFFEAIGYLAHDFSRSVRRLSIVQG